MKKLNKAELNEIRGGETICLWTHDYYDVVIDRRAVGGRVRGQHIDNYLGALWVRVNPYKYGKK